MKTFKEYLDEAEKSRKILTTKKRKQKTIIYTYPWNVGGYVYSMTSPVDSGGDSGGSVA